MPSPWIIPLSLYGAVIGAASGTLSATRLQSKRMHKHYLNLTRNIERAINNRIKRKDLASIASLDYEIIEAEENKNSDDEKRGLIGQTSNP